MKRIAKLTFLLVGGLFIVVVSTGCISVWSARAVSEELSIASLPNKEDLVLTGVTVVNVEATTEQTVLKPNQSIYIRAGKIYAIRPDSLGLLPGFKAYAFEGHYVMPGLIDMHTHLLDKSDITQYLSFGVTSVRNMMGLPMHLRWKKKQQTGQLLGSRLRTATPTLNDGPNKGPFHKKAKNARSIRKKLEKYKKAGYDFVKVYNGLTPEAFQVLIQVADSMSLTVAGHPVNAITREEFLSSGVVSFEHVEEVFNTYMKRRIDDSLATVIAQEFVEHRMPLVVTLSAYHHLYRTATEGEAFRDAIPKKMIAPMARFIGHRQTAGYLDLEEKYVQNIQKKDAYLRRLTQIFHEEGVTLLMGTDQGPNLTVAGKTLHDEILLWAEAGIPNLDIIKASTLHAGSVFDPDLKIGVIEEGYLADLLILETNPVADLMAMRSPKAMVFDGRFLNKQSINEIGQAALQKTGWFIMLGNFLDHLIFN